MTEFVVRFDTDNDAFENGNVYEIGRILREIADEVEDGFKSRSIRDVNGNTIGNWTKG